MMTGVSGEGEEVTGPGTTCVRFVGSNCCYETRGRLHSGGTEVGDGEPVEEEKLDGMVRFLVADCLRISPRTGDGIEE